MDDIPEAKLPAARQTFGGMTAALKGRAKDFLWASIILILSDEECEQMNLIELQSKSTAELRDIYNGLASKQIKRFAERVEAEKRTAQQLIDAGKWEGPLPGAAKAGGKAAKKAAAKAAPKAGKPTPAPTPAKAAKAPRQPKTGVGAPKANHSYRVLNGDAKMNAASARTKVFTFVRDNGGKLKAGVDRETIENHFVDDETVNVKASLDYLVKVEILSVVKD